MAEQEAVSGWGRYVDLDEALNRLCGNKTMYKSLLTTFKNENQYSQLQRELQEGDIRKAASTAHAIKGVAANLSLREVYAATVEMESELKRGVCSDAKLYNLDRAFNETLRCLDVVIDNL